jgi:hypothetical protein
MSNTVTTRNKEIAEIIKQVRDDRNSFVKYIVHGKPTKQQEEGLIAFDDNDYLSIKSGHGTGKSAKQAWNILHYMCTRPFCKVLCTAPSKHQLQDVLWAELSKWHKQMHPLFREMFVWTKEKFYHKDHPEDWFAVARTATKENPEALQGFHADYILQVIDEGSAVPDEVYEVLEGAYGRLETKVAQYGNPTRLTGNFNRSFNKDSAFYKTLTWSCLDSPNVPDRYAKRIEKKYGIDSNMYRIRVLGEFPLRDGDSFIPYDLAYDASIREVIEQVESKKVFGVDVARYGDDETAIAIRHGDKFLPIHSLRQKGTMEVAGYVAKLANEHKPQSIFVDVIGIGAGVFDRLEELGFPVVPVNVSETPATDPKLYKKMRDELWGKGRDWLETRRGSFVDDDDQDIIGQLSTPTYKIMSDGKIKIESKDDLRKRGVASPNKADAILMTFCLPSAAYIKEDDFYDEFYQEEDNEIVDREAGY